MKTAQKTADTPKKKTELMFGEFLVYKGILSQDELAEVLASQRQQGGRLGEVILRLKILNDEQVAKALAEYLSVEYIPLDDIAGIDMNVALSLPESIARRFNLVAIGETDNKVVVAMADPLNVVAIDTIRVKLKRQIEVALGSAEQIRRAIEAIYHGCDVEERRLRDLVEVQADSEEGQENLVQDNPDSDLVGEASATRAPVIRFVELLMSQAVKSRASDIHIEPQEHSMTIRMRIDGVLRDMVPPARGMQAAVITRIKILSEMNIAERRLPQDGRFKINSAGRDIDVRVSVIPTIYGEKVV
ncbi:MAG: type II secretion system protein GspE, partial [Planctomycetota bacterium]